MIRRTALYFALLLVVSAPAARADDRVPPIPTADLPVVGTCAPIETQDVTHVRVGSRDDLKWFEVSGLREPVDYPQLVQILRQRAGTQRPSPHGVWLTASQRHGWLHALVVIKAALEAGLYRVGVRVRSETTGEVMGFPLFIPAEHGEAPGLKAGRLSVRVDAKHPREVKEASDVGHVYAATKRAVERQAEFGVSRVVGKIWISPNAPLQYALAAIDLLYRGGCAGVGIQLSLRSSWRGLDVVPVLEIQGGVASRHAQALTPPPVAPRDRPWGIDGANEPGWVDFQLEDLPSIDAPANRPGQARPEVRPNYAATPGGVPAEVMRGVDYEVRTWAYGFGQDLAKLLRGPAGTPKADGQRFAAAQRRTEVLPGLLTPLRQTFPDATVVIPYAMQFSAFLFDGGTLRGRADLTLLTAGDRERVRVLFASWKALDPTSALTLVPFGVDPFAAGENAAFRIWCEGLLQDVKQRGVAAIPLAEAAHLLPSLPSVAHEPTTRALAGRTTQLADFAAQVARTSYDRVVLVAQRTTASVVAGRTVVGVLELRLTPEEGQLRIIDATGRRAR